MKEIQHLSLAAIFGAVNALVRPAKPSPWLYFIEFVLSVTVATLVGFISVDMGLGNSLSFSLTAISALLARDILTLITGFGDYVTENKNSLFKTLFSKLFDVGMYKLKGKDSTKDGQE